MTALSDRRTLPGLILVVIGLVLLGAQWFEITGFGALGAIAVVFLASYAVTRSYGLLIPGMILAGLAVGVGLQESGYDPQGGLTVVGLACGFFGIYVVDVLLAGHTVRWWPLIPGGILAVVGGSELSRGTVAADAVARFWPIVLVIAGVLVLFSSLRASAHRSSNAG